MSSLLFLFWVITAIFLFCFLLVLLIFFSLHFIEMGNWFSYTCPYLRGTNSRLVQIFLLQNSLERIVLSQVYEFDEEQFFNDLLSIKKLPEVGRLSLCFIILCLRRAIISIASGNCTRVPATFGFDCFINQTVLWSA